MKGSGGLSGKEHTPLPRPTTAAWHLQRKYYIMRGQLHSVTVNPAVTLQERRQKGYNLLQKSSKRSKKCFEANWSELSGYTKNCDEVPAVGLG